MALDFASDLAAMYADFGESVTVAGTTITAIFNGGFTAVDGVAGTQPSLRCRASDVSAVAVGAVVVRGAVSYVVRGIEPLAPDEREIVLVLERA